jgi:hypothetical protein
MLELTKRAHAHQSRNGGRVPYWIHTQGVADTIRCAIEAGGEIDPGGGLADDLFLAAQAHDLLEDTDVGAGELRARFGERVAAWAEGMTNRAGDHDRAAYLAQMRAAPEEVRLIKLADLTDSGSRREVARGVSRADRHRDARHDRDDDVRRVPADRRLPPRAVRLPPAPAGSQRRLLPRNLTQGFVQSRTRIFRASRTFAHASSTPGPPLNSATW